VSGLVFSNGLPQLRINLNSRMIKFTSRTYLRLVIIICTLVIGLLAPIVITKRSAITKTFICDQCGIRLWISSDTPIAASNWPTEIRNLEQTELSRWFNSHISTNCQHTFKLNHSSQKIYATFAELRLWKISRISGSSFTPTLIYLSSDDRDQVESLLRESPEACRDFIHAKLQGKEETEIK
jgi:hypothetical protein